MYIEEKITLMSDPLFSHEAFTELNTVNKKPARRNKVKDFLIVSDGKTAADDSSHHSVHCATAVMI